MSRSYPGVGSRVAIVDDYAAMAGRAARRIRTVLREACGSRHSFSWSEGKRTMMRAYSILVLMVMAGPMAARAQTEAYPTALPTVPTVPAVPTIPNLPRHDISPAAQASRQQSGLAEAQAQDLLREKGYKQILALRPEPNSIWIWQADAMKNGRRVTPGIDYRGNLVETSSSAARPCKLVGVRPGAIGGFTGSRLLQADRCSE